jgi:DNA-binding IscR family transcriptional regulator
MEQGARRANVHAKIMLALSVVLEAARALMGKGEGFEIARYAEKKRIPVRFMNEVTDELIQAGLIAELSEKNGRFVLLKAPETVKIRDIVDVIMHSGVEPKALGMGTIDPKIDHFVKKASDGINNSLTQTSVQDLMTD